MQVETIKIVREGYRLGWVIINKSDFDPKKHVEYGKEKEAGEKALTKNEIAEKLTALGVEFDKTAKKEVLEALLEEAEKPEE